MAGFLFQTDNDPSNPANWDQTGKYNPYTQSFGYFQNDPQGTLPKYSEDWGNYGWNKTADASQYDKDYYNYISQYRANPDDKELSPLLPYDPNNQFLTGLLSRSVNYGKNEDDPYLASYSVSNPAIAYRYLSPDYHYIQGNWNPDGTINEIVSQGTYEPDQGFMNSWFGPNIVKPASQIGTAAAAIYTGGAAYGAAGAAGGAAVSSYAQTHDPKAAALAAALAYLGYGSGGSLTGSNIDANDAWMGSQYTEQGIGPYAAGNASDANDAFLGKQYTDSGIGPYADGASIDANDKWMGEQYTNPSSTTDKNISSKLTQQAIKTGLKLIANGSAPASINGLLGASSVPAKTASTAKLSDSSAAYGSSPLIVKNVAQAPNQAVPVSPNLLAEKSRNAKTIDDFLKLKNGWLGYQNYA